MILPTFQYLSVSIVPGTGNNAQKHVMAAHRVVQEPSLNSLKMGDRNALGTSQLQGPVTAILVQIQVNSNIGCVKTVFLKGTQWRTTSITYVY